MARLPLVPLAIFIATAFALLPDLGGQYVWSKDEARDGLVARDMVKGGRWLIPHVGGGIYRYKPPLFHWLVALSSPRGVTEWSLRLPSVLAAAATVALTYAMAARLWTPVTGLGAAAILASSAMFVEWARTGRLEMLLTLWLTLGFWSVWRFLEEGRRRHALALGLALGLGGLTKGPIGLLPLGALIVALWVSGRWSRRALADAGLALALALALPVAWLGLAAGTQAGVGEYLKAVSANFVHEVRGHHDRHVLFAAQAIGLGFLPWTLLLPGALLVLIRTRRTSWRVLLVPLLWVGFILLVFTVFISPRAVYFLPICPALAILVTWAWSVCSDAERRWMLYPLVLMAIAGVVGGLGLAIWPVALESPRYHTVLGRQFGLAIAALAGVTGLGVVAVLRRRRVDIVPALVGAGTLLAMVVFHVTVYTPRANRSHPTREAAARFTALLPPEAEVVYVDQKSIAALLFYMRPRLIQLPRVHNIVNLAEFPERYALLLHEEMVVLIWGQCSPPPPLREETLFGSRYVLLSLDGVGPRCEWAPARVTPGGDGPGRP